MASALAGRWRLTMRTPIGGVEAEMAFVDEGGALTGAATGRDETVALRDIRVEPVERGEHVTWHQSITRPIRLDLAFDVVVEGDSMRGHSRAGRLPRSTVVGRRLREA